MKMYNFAHRNHHLQTSKASLESSWQGTSLFMSTASNQRSCTPKGSSEEVQVHINYLLSSWKFFYYVVTYVDQFFCPHFMFVLQSVYELGKHNDLGYDLEEQNNLDNNLKEQVTLIMIFITLKRRRP